MKRALLLRFCQKNKNSGVSRVRPNGIPSACDSAGFFRLFSSSAMDFLRAGHYQNCTLRPARGTALPAFFSVRFLPLVLAACARPFPPARTVSVPSVRSLRACRSYRAVSSLLIDEGDFLYWACRQKSEWGAEKVRRVAQWKVLFA